MNNDIIRYIELARKIKAKSETGQINWSRASYIDTYEAPLGDGMVAISKSVMSNNVKNSQPSFNLAFKNNRGETFFNLRNMENADHPELLPLLSSIYGLAMGMQMRGHEGQTLSNMEHFINTL